MGSLAIVILVMSTVFVGSVCLPHMTDIRDVENSHNFRRRESCFFECDSDVADAENFLYCLHQLKQYVGRQDDIACQSGWLKSNIESCA